MIARRLLALFRRGRLGIGLDAPVLLVVRHHVVGEQLEGLVLPLVENLLAGTIEVLLNLFRRGLFLINQLGDHTRAARVDRPADVPHRQVEELRRYLEWAAARGQA